MTEHIVRAWIADGRVSVAFPALQDAVEKARVWEADGLTRISIQIGSGPEQSWRKVADVVADEPEQDG